MDHLSLLSHPEGKIKSRMKLTLAALAQRVALDICVDVFIPDCFKWGSGVIFQIRKERAQDEGFQWNILMSAFADSPGMRMAIAVE